MSTFKLLMFGDIMGKPGRKSIIKELPQLKEKYQPDLVIANVENLTHGYGVTESNLDEMVEAGINFFTSGNHIFKRDGSLDTIFKNYPLIRPANYPTGTKGEGYKIFESGVNKILVINLIGQTYFEENCNSFLKKVDEILEETKHQNIKIIIVDFHAEATSEKKALGHYLDGKVSLVAGTHTHIQTADEQIQNKGTGYITDLGMIGLKDSSLGVDFKNIIKSMKTGEKYPKEIPDSGLCTINGIFAKINIKTGKTTTIERINIETDI